MTSISTSSAAIAPYTTSYPTEAAPETAAAAAPAAAGPAGRGRPDPAAIFAQADTDGDSMLSSTEFLAMHELMGERGGPRGHGGPHRGGMHGHHHPRQVDGGGVGAAGDEYVTGGGDTSIAALRSQVEALTAQVQSLLAAISGSYPTSIPTASASTGAATLASTADAATAAKDGYAYSTDSAGTTYATDEGGNTYQVNADGTGTLVASAAGQSGETAAASADTSTVTDQVASTYAQYA